MEIIVENIISTDSLRRNRNLEYDSRVAGREGAPVSFREQLYKHINQIGMDRSALEVQAQFAPVISQEKMSYIQASNVVNRLRVKG